MRYVSPSTIAYVKQWPCIHCGATQGIDAHHVKSKGSGGGDYIENLMPLCRQAHRLMHDKGLTYMCNKFEGIEKWLIDNEWEYNKLTGWSRE